MLENSRRTLARGSSTYSDDATNADGTTVAGNTTFADDTTTTNLATNADNATIAGGAIDATVITTTMADRSDYQSHGRHREVARVAHWGDAWPDAPGRYHTRGAFHSQDGPDDDFSSDALCAVGGKAAEEHGYKARLGNW
jgi:hypothetical protein